VVAVGIDARLEGRGLTGIVWWVAIGMVVVGVLGIVTAPLPSEKGSEEVRTGLSADRRAQSRDADRLFRKRLSARSAAHNGVLAGPPLPLRQRQVQLFLFRTTAQKK